MYDHNMYDYVYVYYIYIRIMLYMSLLCICLGLMQVLKNPATGNTNSNNAHAPGKNSGSAIRDSLKIKASSSTPILPAMPLSARSQANRGSNPPLPARPQS